RLRGRGGVGLSPHGEHALAQHRQAARHGARVRLLDLRQERAQRRRAGLERGGPHELHDREPHRRGHDHGEELHPHPSLHARRPVPHRMTPPANSRGAEGDAGVSIAAVETSSIAQGIVAADAMVKRAEVDLLQASVLSPGRYWILIGGRVADVRSAHARGIEVAADTLLDQLFIPQLHDGVMPALRGLVAPSDADAVGVLETLTAASAIVAADAAAKAAGIVVADLRLANGIGGKGVVTVTGTLPDVEAAVAAGRADAQKRGLLARAVVIPRMHPVLREHLV